MSSEAEVTRMEKEAKIERLTWAKVRTECALPGDPLLPPPFLPGAPGGDLWDSDLRKRCRLSGRSPAALGHA